MHFCRVVPGLFAVLMLFVQSAVGQSEAPEFDVDVVAVQGEDAGGRTRVDLYTKVPFARLQFVRSSSGFVAEYQVTAEVFQLGANNRRGNLVQSHVWERPVQAEQFGATQSDKLFDALTQSLTFEPGRYLLNVQLSDQSSGRTYQRQVPFLVRDLRQDVAVSDLILLDDYDANENTISPSVGGRISTDDAGFRFFYEVYAKQPTSVSITREVIKLNKSNSEPSMRALFAMDRDREEFGEVAYTRLEDTPLRRGKTQIIAEIPLSNLAAGDYMLRVNVQNEDGTLLDQAQKIVTVQWTGLADHIQNLEEAISQLQYIAKDKDVKYIREGRSESEKMSRFREFWKKRDPTPSTDRNENMEEYYYRIAFANRKYGALTSGWRTDRGNVMIRFGEPDFVEARPFNFDVEPYEIWYYYRLGRRFIFIDKTGFGDYQLWVPIWDERTRIR